MAVALSFKRICFLNQQSKECIYSGCRDLYFVLVQGLVHLVFSLKVINQGLKQV